MFKIEAKIKKEESMKKTTGVILGAFFAAAALFFFQAGCGGGGGGGSSAKSELAKLQSADISDPTAVGNIFDGAMGMADVGMMGMDRSGMSMMKATKIPGLKALGLGKAAPGDCMSQDQNNTTCECYVSGTVSINVVDNQDSGSVTITFNDCKDDADAPAINGEFKLSGSGTDTSAKISASADLTQGEGFFKGTATIDLTSDNSGNTTVKAEIDFSGADWQEPDNIGYLYLNGTVVLTSTGIMTINGIAQFGTTKDGKVDVKANDIIFDANTCASEPVSGTLIISSGDQTVTITFDGAATCDGKAKCTGAISGTLDLETGEIIQP